MWPLRMVLEIQNHQFIRLTLQEICTVNFVNPKEENWTEYKIDHSVIIGILKYVLHRVLDPGVYVKNPVVLNMEILIFVIDWPEMIG